MASLPSKIFREYDIRGKDGTELTEYVAEHISRGFSVLLKNANVYDCILGRDTRVSSEIYRNAFVKGLTESGINVIDIGICTTPMSYWAQHHLRVNGLVMITASHNPSGWNGFKLGTGISKTLLPDEVKNLRKIIESESYFYAEKNGEMRIENIQEKYEDDLISRAPIAKKMRVLVNTGNGTAGLFAPTLLRKAGCEVAERYTEVDPSYPHYTANPDGTKMMEDTGIETVKYSCDIGFAFDGDGDRLGVTDEKGHIIWPDRYTMLLARDILEKKLGAKIIFDVKVSESLPEDIISHGGIPIMWKTGHSYIKAKLREENAALAGEMSGHIFFNEGYYGFDDSFFAALKILEYVSKQNEPLSEIIENTPYYISTPTIQLDTTDEEKYKIVEEIKQEFVNEKYKVIDLSGARVYTEDGWGLIRASSNTPTFVLRFESKTEDGLARIQEIFKKKLARFPDLNLNWNIED